MPTTTHQTKRYLPRRRRKRPLTHAQTKRVHHPPNNSFEKKEDMLRGHRNSDTSFQSFERSFKASDRQNVERELIKMFKTPFTPTKYRPQDDYYTYINYQWISDKTAELTKTTKHYVQIDSFRVVQEKVYYELMDIVKEYIHAHSSHKASAIRAVYESMYHLDERCAQDCVNHYLALVDRCLATGNLYELLGTQNRNELISWGCPLVWSVVKDEKNVQQFKSTLSAPQLTLYDYELYIEDEQDDAPTAAYKREFKRKYMGFVQDMFALCLGRSDHGLKPSDVWDCEYDMLSALGCNEPGLHDDADGYNVVTTAAARDTLGFDWAEFARVIGYKHTPSSFICRSTNYVKCVLETLTKDNAWQSPKWRTYFLYMGFRQIMRFHKEWRHVYFEFFGRFIKGQPVPYPQELYPVFGLSMCFNTFLTNQYIARNRRTEYIDYTFNMATDLLQVFKRIIGRNTWLSASTKRYALRKLENIHLEVGSPKLLREDPLLDYDSRNAYQNMQRIAYWRCRQMIDLDGTRSTIDIPLIDWAEFKIIGKQSYVVNAYYTPTENSIYVPLAYLQPPFIDLKERGIEYNLAHIGYTLGHEMSHCLDDMGSKYDERGNLHNWWTPKDRAKFNAKVRNVIQQYEHFARYDGIDMDASLSTGENLADISGMAICEEYLKDFQEKNNDIVPIRALSFHAFFVYLAVQARQKIFDKAVKAQLKTNPHPMDKYRTNCPLSRLELFRSLYNIKKTDKMYWPSTDTIW